MDFDALPRFVAIVGSREFPRQDWVEAFVERLKPDTIVVSGGAKGVDSWAVRTAKSRGLLTKVFPVEGWEWDVIGMTAGHVRNFVLLNYIKRTNGHVVAFASLNDKGVASAGTLNTMLTARSMGIPVTSYETKG